MADSPSNGYDSSRLDRIEKTMELIAAGHARFEEEHRWLVEGQKGLQERQKELQEGQKELQQGQKGLQERQDRLEQSQQKLVHGMQQLLTAQVILTDRVDKTSQTLEVFIEQTNQRFQEAARSHQETDEKLNALIETVDDWIRRQPPQAGA